MSRRFLSSSPKPEPPSYSLKSGIKVAMQDRPDLRLSFNGETIYAEVKHYNEKATDRNDANAMAAAPLSSPKSGMSSKMKASMDGNRCAPPPSRRSQQYAPGFPNILVFRESQRRAGLAFALCRERIR